MVSNFSAATSQVGPITEVPLDLRVGHFNSASDVLGETKAVAVAKLRAEQDRRPNSQVARLPEEVWPHIFCWFSLSERAILASVSRDWCVLIRGDPLLWASGEVTSFGALKAVRRFSSDLAWDIHLIPGSRSDRLWVEVKQDLRRLHSLRICVPDDTADLGLLDALLECSFPLLQELTICYDYQSSINGPPVILLPAHFGSRLAPRVTNFHLHAILIFPDDFEPWPSIVVFSAILHRGVWRRRLLEVLPNAHSIIVDGGNGFPVGPVPPLLTNLRIDWSAEDPWGQDSDVSIGTAWGMGNSLRQLHIDVNDGTTGPIRLHSIFRLFVEKIYPDRPFAFICGLSPKISAGVRIESNTLGGFIVGANFRQTAFAWIDNGLSRDVNLTRLCVDRMAFCRLVQREIQLPAVVELSLQFCIPSLDPGVCGFERALSLLDYGKVLFIDDNPRVLRLPLLQRILVTRPPCNHDHGITGHLDDGNMQNWKNRLYGFSNNSDDLDREVAFYTKFAPVCMQKHIVTTPDFTAKVCVQITREAMLRAQQRGYNMPALYRSVSQARTVPLVHNDIV